MKNSSGLLATVMIASKDRLEDLLNTLKELRTVDGYDRFEVIVTDDGSRENMVEKLKPGFPEVAFYRFEKNQGLIIQRNRMMKLARANFIFSLDDEAWFLGKNSVMSALEVFRAHPRAGILNFAVTEPQMPEKRQEARCEIYAVAQYIGCAHAIRRSILDFEYGPYDPFYYRQGEERDLAIQCLDQGYEILQVDSIKVFHNYQGQGRDHQWIHAFAFRNELFFYLKFFPGMLCPIFLLRSSVAHCLFCFRKRWFRAFFMGFMKFVYGFSNQLKRRKPVKVATAQTYLALIRK